LKNNKEEEEEEIDRILMRGDVLNITINIKNKEV
jgi:hypothetical protein